MTKKITGRRIDLNGQFVEDTGFAYTSGSRLADLLEQRISPLLSQPYTGEFVFALVSPADTGGEFERGAGVFPPGNTGPPEHFHPTYDEHFDIVQGEFIFLLDGKEKKVSAGDQLLVPKGVAHTFRCVGKQLGVTVTETRPAARIGNMIATLFGSAHEGKLDAKGQPDFWHTMLICREYADDTIFTNLSPRITLPLCKLLAPISRRMGYRAVAPKYLEEKFWDLHVEQPPRNLVENL